MTHKNYKFGNPGGNPSSPRFSIDDTVMRKVRSYKLRKKLKKFVGVVLIYVDNDEFLALLSLLATSQ